MASEAKEDDKLRFFVSGCALVREGDKFAHSVTYFGCADAASEFSDWLSSLQAAAEESRKRAEEAVEQANVANLRAANIEERTKKKLAEFEKIATGKHPLYVMRADPQVIQPGDYCFRRTGDTRQADDCEWYRNGNGHFINRKGGPTQNEYPIYRRIDAPQVADAGEGEPDIVEYDGKRYRREAEKRPPKQGETFWGSLSNQVMIAPLDFMLDAYHVLHEITAAPSPAPSTEAPEPVKYWVTPVVSDFEWGIESHEGPMGVKVIHIVLKDEQLAHRIAAYLNGDSPEHATLREQADEIERLKKEAVRKQAEFDKVIDESAEKYANMIVDRLSEVIAEHEPPASLPGAGEAAAEGSGGEPWYAHTISKGLNELRDKLASGEPIEGRRADGTKVAVFGKAAPAPAAESDLKGQLKHSPAEAYHVSLTSADEWGLWRQTYDANLSYRLVAKFHNAHAATDFRQCMAECRAQLAQLAAYKRDAEAWEAVRKHRIDLLNDHEVQFHAVVQGRFHDASDPADAVLALASQLEKGGES